MAKLIFDATEQSIKVGSGGIKIDPGATDLLEVSNGILLPDGSVGEPSLRFNDDTNTGIYSPLDESVAIVSNGVEFARFGPDASVINGLSYPTADGNAGQVMTTDGAGNITFADAAAGGGGAASNPNAHKYWRVHIYENNGDVSYIVAVGIQLLDPDGNNLAVGGTATASSQNSPYTANFAFAPWTATSADYWSSTTNNASWVAYELPVEGEVRSITMTGVRLAARMPKSFSIQWSDDGTLWHDAGYVTGQTGWAVGGTDTRTFTVYPELNPSIAIAVSQSPTVVPTARGTHSIALGQAAKAQADYGIALGGLSNAQAVNSIAIGRVAGAAGVQGIAIGYGAQAGVSAAGTLGTATTPASGTLVTYFGPYSLRDKYRHLRMWMSGESTSATPVDILLRNDTGAGVAFSLYSNKTAACEARIVARVKNGGPTDVLVRKMHFVLQGAYGGAVSFLSPPTTLYEQGVTAWTCIPTISGSELKFIFTGEASKQINVYVDMDVAMLEDM